jgi:riboflavin synthase
VSGHVDGCGEVVGIEDSGDGGRFLTFEVPATFERYLIEKGSVGIDGISLTVVRPEARRFGVALIPVTLDVTSLGVVDVGTPVHLEADMIGKWVERMVGGRR